MAGRFQFESPGAAATGEIVKLLAERKADERQRLLDSLQFSADQRAQEAAARQATESQARLASQKQQDEMSRLGTMASFLEPGDNPAERGWSPEDTALGQKWGMFKSMPVPQVSTAITGMQDETGAPTEGFTPEQAPQQTPQTRLGFVGDAKQREHRRLQDQTGAVISSLLKDPAKKEAGMFLAQMAAAHDGIVPEEQLATYLAPDVPLSVFDESTGKITSAGSTRPTGKVFTRNRPPASYYTERMPTYVGKDPNDPNKSVFMRPDGTTFSVVGQRGAAATAGETLGIPVGYTKPVEDSIGAMGLDPESVDEAALADYRAKAAAAIMHSKTSRSAQKIAISFLNSPDMATTASDEMIDAGQLTAKDAADIAALLDAVAPEHIKDILRQNPYTPHKNEPSWYSRFFNGTNKSK